MSKRTLGIFCHGGAFRSAYTNGFLKCLDDNAIEVDKYVGVSASFYAIFAHLAGVNEREMWTRSPDSPMYENWHKFNLFRKFVDFHTPKIMEKTPYSEETILARMKKCTAIATRFWDLGHDTIGDFKSIDEIKEATLATGSIPWFLLSFPHKFRETRYIDGGFKLSNYFSYLDTGIKVVIIPSSTSENKSDPGYMGNGCFGYINDYPDNFRTFAWGEPEDYRLLWDKGYEDAKKFVEELSLIAD
jgi:predicted patatin/cPLA2 family phospholipase